MNMVDNIIRKACDRCHAQKLSCKRNGGEGSCERCARLKADCKSSPSLRYKKQQQQQQQKQQQQSQSQQPPHHISSAEATAAAAAAQGSRPSPKRRRTTESEMSLVQPEAGRCPRLFFPPFPVLDPTPPTRTTARVTSSCFRVLQTTPFSIAHIHTITHAFRLVLPLVHRKAHTPFSALHPQCR